MSVTSNQTWNAQQYSEHARFVSDLGMPVVELLAPVSGERILDLGCGDGVLTEKVVALGCNVVGIDASAEMIAAAKALGLDARVMDGHALDFNGEFDAVFSNAALHWLKQPKKVIDGVWRALKPGGRFVGEFGGYGNVTTIVTALEYVLRESGIDPGTVNPWYNPTAEEYRTVLEERGFVVNMVALFPRPTPLPGNVVAWLETFAQSFAAAFPDSARPAFFDAVAELCRPKLYDTSGQWHADYVRLRFSAAKPPSAA
ncbi:MAG TPA: class I SAM-dependent methyltransferase [Casimicrobiaceae bacterium]|jgi:trans-aconitate methyltransferase